MPGTRHGMVPVPGTVTSNQKLPVHVPPVNHNNVVKNVAVIITVPVGYLVGVPGIINGYYESRKLWTRLSCLLRQLLTVDPNQNPKTYFWIDFGFGQLTQKLCSGFWEILNAVNHLSTVM